MSDPSARYQADPHPLSEHRTPSEILLDEAGPIGRPDVDEPGGKHSAQERGEDLRNKPKIPRRIKP